MLVMGRQRRHEKHGKEAHPLAWLRAFVGPLIVLGGWGVISPSYYIGVLAIYVGLAISLFEIVYDPLINKKPLPVLVSALAVVLFLTDWFTIGLVGARPSLNFYSYAMRKGNHSDGTNVNGIIWDSHFTELRVTITNPTGDDYGGLDLAIRPDRFTHEAAILNGPAGCDLSRFSGGSTINVAAVKASGPTTVTATKVGEAVDVHDTKSDEYSTVASDTGYRLRCSTFPANYTLQVVFALVAFKPEAMNNFRPDTQGVSPGGWAMKVSQLPDTYFDSLDARPSPRTVDVVGVYKRLKTFSISRAVDVKDGD
jgi:hypothetical protein